MSPGTRTHTGSAEYHPATLSQGAVSQGAQEALAPGLRQLPKLEHLNLCDNQIGDRGLASLLTEPMQGVLSSLRHLFLYDNQITDSGCAALASALRNGALHVDAADDQRQRQAQSVSAA